MTTATMKEIEIPCSEDSPFSKIVVRLRDNSPDENGNGNSHRFRTIGQADVYVNVPGLGDMKLDTLRLTTTTIDARIREYKDKETGEWKQFSDAKIVEREHLKLIANAIAENLEVQVQVDGEEV